MDKENVHILNGTLFNHKKEAVLPFGIKCMSLVDAMLSKTIQVQKENNLTFMWNLKKMIP
jgi:hypothetical protein